MNQMCFTIPVERKYETEDDETLKEIANAIEAIYEKVRINGVNKTGCVHISGPARYVLYGMQLKRRTKTMVSSASISSNAGAILPCRPKCRKSAKRNCGRFSTSMTIWWQCASSTPSQKETDNVLFRLLYEGHVQELFQQNGLYTDAEIETRPIPIGKIPAVYLWRPAPIYDGIANNRSDIELTLSRTSDVIRKTPLRLSRSSATSSEISRTAEKPARFINSNRVETSDWCRLPYRTMQSNTTSANSKRTSKKIPRCRICP